jgi:hypothetical protein
MKQEVLGLIPTKMHLWIVPRRHRGFTARWQACDSFRAYDGAGEGWFVVFNANAMSDAAVDTLMDRHCECVAQGTIGFDRKEWRFSAPKESDRCEGVLRRLIADGEVCQYYRNFHVCGPNGEDLGSIKD